MNHNLGMSICIPVYNFCEFLGPTLQLIMPQLGEHDEVVVYDLGSELPIAFERSRWGRAARLFALSKAGTRTLFLSEILLDKRGDNDSFLGNSLVNRVGISINRFLGLAKAHFGESPSEALKIRRIVAREHGIEMFVYLKVQWAKSQNRSREKLDQMARSLFASGPSVGRARAFFYRHAPVFAISLVWPVVEGTGHLFPGFGGGTHHEQD